MKTKLLKRIRKIYAIEKRGKKYRVLNLKYNYDASDWGTKEVAFQIRRHLILRKAYNEYNKPKKLL